MKPISFGGIKHGIQEYLAVIRVLISKWHTSGKENKKLERLICDFTGSKFCTCVNSGSSANLLALASLNLPKNSKVITSGCGFPATLNPILHLGLQPVLVDYDIPSYNIDINQVIDAVKKEKDNIKAIIFAHTLGNPVDIIPIKEICDKYNIHIIEDCCESLGSFYKKKHVGTYGKLGTFSFYPSHQINGMGMGGAVITDDEELIYKIRSMKTWGKISTLETEKNIEKITNYSCFVDDIAYDEQFTYETCGWNMLMPDTAAAYACVQMSRLKGFTKKRIENFNYLQNSLSNYPTTKMKVLDDSNPAYYGYVVTLQDGNRNDLALYLLKNNIKSRPFFAGNITRHKPFKHLYQNLPVADFLMKNSLFVGCWHGLNLKDMEYVSSKIKNYIDTN